MKIGGAVRVARIGCIAALLLASAWACSDGERGASTVERAPARLDDQECSVCGMLVRDQPAPRAQLVHHDDTRAFACSIGDLLVHLSAPSPHGRADDVWVEVLAPDDRPAERATDAHRWVRAGEAWYVVGIERGGVMGAPVLAYATRSPAESAARSHDGARVLDWPGLEAWWSALQR